MMFYILYQYGVQNNNNLITVNALILALESRGIISCWQESSVGSPQNLSTLIRIRYIMALVLIILLLQIWCPLKYLPSCKCSKRQRRKNTMSSALFIIWTQNGRIILLHRSWDNNCSLDWIYHPIIYRKLVIPLLYQNA